VSATAVHFYGVYALATWHEYGGTTPAARFICVGESLTEAIAIADGVRQVFKVPVWIEEQYPTRRPAHITRRSIGVA
jgi:hypothetical protein